LQCFEFLPDAFTQKFPPILAPANTPISMKQTVRKPSRNAVRLYERRVRCRHGRKAFTLFELRELISCWVVITPTEGVFYERPLCSILSRTSQNNWQLIARHAFHFAQLLGCVTSTENPLHSHFRCVILALAFGANPLVLLLIESRERFERYSCLALWFWVVINCCLSSSHLKNCLIIILYIS
jgi:hypothetical protein